MLTRFPAILWTVLICAALAACNLPNANSDQPTATTPPEQPATAPPPTDTVTPLPPTFTATPTDTPTPAVTATATLTPTANIPIANVFKDTNCRSGPGQSYDLVVLIKADTKVEVVAKDLGGGYWYVRTPDQPDAFCWLWGSNATIEGDTSALPAYTPPPSPTPAPDFTVEFKNFDACKGTFARFIVVNTGGYPFRSAYVKVTDTKTSEVTENSVNAFDLTVGCIVAQNISPLASGATGYLQSDHFKKDPKGHKLLAVIMLCTEQGLAGVCVTKTLEIK
jgi:hypothetical protein